MADLPTIEQAFGGQGQLPSADQVFGPEEGQVKSGPAQDSFFSFGTVSHVLDAFSQGAKDGWGDTQHVLSPDAEAWLKKSGVFNDYKNGQTSFVKGANEALMRPAAAALDLIVHPLASAGALVSGVESATAQLGEEAQQTKIGQAIGARELGRAGAGMLEYSTSRGDIQLRPMTATDLATAKSLRVMGEGEGGYFDLKERTSHAADGLAAAVKEIDSEKEGLPPSTGEPGTPEEVARSAQGGAGAAPDIHALARSVAPDTFQAYDALNARREAYRRQIQELSVARPETPEGQAAQARIDEILSKVNGVEDRLTNAAAQRLEDARAELVKDTPDMAATRKLLLETDYKMRDLAPQVAAAYREAQGRIPEETPRPESVVSHETTPEAQAPEVRPVPAEAAPELAPPNVAGEKLGGSDIASDVAQKLVAAGRPEEEANAAAAIVAAHYETRAARLGGIRGTASEMYARDAPNIVGAGRRRAMAMAQGETYHQGRRGSIILAESRNTIKLFKDADASTFMHETGHQWLEELMADAAEAHTPNELKADAATVRGWLGITEPTAPITRRQHEQFARGFERYLMEGVAPSKQLAAVFAKFREWLTKIYQTVNRLRSPINDDIRSVFDRLIVTNPERTVIAPERPVEAEMADIHEAEAENTPPERAGPVADNIRNEIDRVAAEKVPDVHAELGAGTQAGGIAAENADIAGSGNEAAVARGEGNASALGTQPEGGNEPAAKGGGTRAEPITDPNAAFRERTDAGLIDKAGNIVLDNLNTTEDVKSVLRQVADNQDQFMSARRGVVSDADVLSYADAMGVKAREVNLRKLRAISLEDGIPLAARIRVGREMLVQSAQAVHDAMQGYDEMAYAMAAQRHLMIQETLSAVTAEMGRGLRAFRSMGDEAAKAQNLSEYLQQNTGRTLLQLKQEMAQGRRLDTPAKVSGYLNNARKPSIGDMLLEVFKNWLISGPITHATYSVGNTALALWKAVPETAMEAAIGAIRRTESADRVRFGEVGAQLYAMLRGQRNGFQAAWDALKVGQTTALPGEAEAAALKGATTPFTTTKAVPNFQIGPVSIPLGSAVRLPGERMVAPIHSYFRSIGYAQGIARLAYRQASIEGLRGSAFSQRIAELTREPTKEMMETARFEATEQTLMGKGGELTKRVSSLMNWEPELPGVGRIKPLAFVDPFVHIASNIVEQSVVERSPLAIFSKELREDILGHNGEAKQNSAIARSLTGTALGIVSGGLAMEGLITPSAPADPKEAALWRRVHGMPHSFVMGDISVDLSRLGVLGFMMGVSADLYHAADRIGKDDASKVASLIVHSFAQNFLDEGFMRGPSDLIKALDDNERYGGRYLRNLASDFVIPYSIGMSQVARQVDPYGRQARSLMDEIKAKVPWWSETLFPRRDIWGEPVPNRDWSGVYTQQISHDPVDLALLNVGYYPGPVPRKIRGVALTDQQYDDFARISGRMAKMQLNAMVQMPAFATLPASIRQEMLHEAIVSSRENARSLIMMQYPDIIRQATDAKVEKLKQPETVH